MEAPLTGGLCDQQRVNQGTSDKFRCVRLIEWSAEWLTAVVDSMVDFDVGSRVEVSRWKSLRQRRRIGLSID